MKRKQAILEEATRLFSRKGFKDASMAELSKITGVAGATIFYHYKTKEELFLSILEEVREGLIGEFERYSDQNRFSTGMEMVEGVVSFYIYMAGIQEDWFLLLHRHFPYDLAEANPTCREHLESIYSCLLDIFEKAILLGQQDGTIAPVSAKKTAMILFAMVDGLVRLKTYNLYDAGALYTDLIASCRRMLQKR